MKNGLIKALPIFLEQTLRLTLHPMELTRCRLTSIVHQEGPNFNCPWPPGGSPARYPGSRHRSESVRRHQVL